MTFNNFDGTAEIPDAVLEDMLTQHPKYGDDMYAALELAKDRGFTTVVLTGMRTVSPYGGDEVVDISVRGMMKATDFQGTMKEIIARGPEAPNAYPSDAETARIAHERYVQAMGDSDHWDG